MNDGLMRRKVYGFLTLCMAVLTLIGLIIPIQTVVEYGNSYGEKYYFASNSSGIDYMGFKSDFSLGITVGVMSWLQLVFAVVSIVLVALSFKRLKKHFKIINKAAALGSVAFNGINFLLGLIFIIYNCVAYRSQLSHFIFSSYSFAPFLLTLALLFIMAKINKKCAVAKPTVTEKGGGSDLEKITEYKKLLDEGTISQGEFDGLKNKILYGEELNK